MIRTRISLRENETRRREGERERKNSLRCVASTAETSCRSLDRRPSSEHLETVLLSCYVSIGEEEGQRLNRVWPWSRTRAKLPEAGRSVAVIPRKVRLFHPVEEMQRAYGGHTSLPARLVVNFVPPGSNVGAGGGVGWLVGFLFPLPVYSTRLSGYDISPSPSLFLPLTGHDSFILLHARLFHALFHPW